MLDADGPSVPPTVRDAVLSRVSRLDPGARGVLDVVASSPTAAELWLLEEVCGDCDDGVAGCLAAGMLVETGGAVGFRHEIAREAVEAAIPARRRRELHRTILTALTSRPVRADPARLAHHAEIAGETGAAVRYARAAAARSASVGAHRQAAAQYGRALRFAGDLAPSHRAALLELRSEALYAADEQVESIADLNAAMALHHEAGDICREADTMRRLVPRLTCRGLMDEALEAAGRAVELLEPLPPGRELGSALAAMAQLYLSIDDLDRAIEWGRRAAVIAAEFDDSETSVEVAITVGTAEFWRGGPARSRGLEQALELARSEGVEADVPRALNNLAWAAVSHRAHPDGRQVDRGGSRLLRGTRPRPVAALDPVGPGPLRAEPGALDGCDRDRRAADRRPARLAQPSSRGHARAGARTGPPRRSGRGARGVGGQRDRASGADLGDLPRDRTRRDRVARRTADRIGAGDG